MIAEIIVKKARQDGIDGFVFVDFKNILEFDDLPTKYLGSETEPCFYLFSNKKIVVWPSGNKEERIFCKVNCFISKENFCKLISILKQAGQRLTDINKKLKKNWIGDKEIVIKI